MVHRSLAVADFPGCVACARDCSGDEVTMTEA